MLLLLYLVDICSSVHTCIICCVDVPSLGWTAFSEEVVVMDSPIGCVFSSITVEFCCVFTALIWISDMH